MKKLFFTALVVAVFGFYFFSEADAQCDPLDEFCVSWFFDCPNCNMGSTTGSTVDCTFVSGGAINTVKQPPTTTTGTFEQTGTAQCVHHPDKGPAQNLGTCGFEFSMSGDGVTVTGCDPAGGDCEVKASCVGTDPTVAGKLTCASRVLFFVLSKNLSDNQCTNLFPLEPVTGGLAAGQLLHASYTKDANGLFQTIGQTRVRGCNADAPDGDCGPGNKRVSGGSSEGGVPFEFAFRQTVNTSPGFCKKGDIDKGNINMDVFGSSTFSVTNVDAGSLECNGETNITCGAPTDLNHDGILDITCNVPSCPTLGPALGALPRNPDGTVTATCTGTLGGGQGIVGVEDVAISPK